MSDSSFASMAFERVGLAPQDASVLVIWGHGWGQSGSIFKPLADTLNARATHFLIDFPGFGASPVPPQSWTTVDYAEALAALIRPYRERGIKKIVYVGHSFGGRVGIQLAARFPDLIDGLFLVGSAGLPRQRSLFKKIEMACRVYTFKTLKHLAPLLGLSVDDLRRRFGSVDYRTAGPMRLLFLSIIREDLSEQARQIRCPTQLLYGSDDTETPPEIGERLNALIQGSSLAILPGLGHVSILLKGRHIVVNRLSKFLEAL